MHCTVPHWAKIIDTAKHRVTIISTEPNSNERFITDVHCTALNCTIYLVNNVRAIIAYLRGVLYGCLLICDWRVYHGPPVIREQNIHHTDTDRHSLIYKHFQVMWLHQQCKKSSQNLYTQYSLLRKI